MTATILDTCPLDLHQDSITSGDVRKRIDDLNEARSAREQDLADSVADLDREIAEIELQLAALRERQEARKALRQERTQQGECEMQDWLAEAAELGAIADRIPPRAYRDWRNGRLVLVHADRLEDVAREMVAEQGQIPDWVEIDWDATCAKLADEYGKVVVLGEPMVLIDNGAQ